MWSECLLDLGTDFLVGNMVFVLDEINQHLCAVSYNMYTTEYFPKLDWKPEGTL